MFLGLTRITWFLAQQEAFRLARLEFAAALARDIGSAVQPKAAVIKGDEDYILDPSVPRWPVLLSLHSGHPCT